MCTKLVCSVIFSKRNPKYKLIVQNVLNKAIKLNERIGTLVIVLLIDFLKYLHGLFEKKQIQFWLFFFMRTLFNAYTHTHILFFFFYILWVLKKPINGMFGISTKIFFLDIWIILFKNILEQCIYL